MFDEIKDFVQHSSGLGLQATDIGMILVQQNLDGKSFQFHCHEIEDVLKRTDSDGRPFIQVNFVSGYKVLFTDTLVGFKPRETLGLDMSRVPKVVTTPDLLRVGEAIEDSLASDHPEEHEFELLKKVYQAILFGGERVGFDLSQEKRHFARLLGAKSRLTA